MPFSLQSLDYDLEQERVTISVSDLAAPDGWTGVNAMFSLKSPQIDPQHEIGDLAVDKAIEVLQAALDFLKTHPAHPKPGVPPAH